MNLHYDVFGHGPNVLLAFHGVGQTGRRCYEPFARHLGNRYTIYAFDLLHHGRSSGLHGSDDFADADVLTKVLWKKFIQEFLEEKKLIRFSIAGFSLGGRFAMATAEAFPERVDQLILMAPDGVVDHPIFRLGTRFYPARRLYKRLSDDPQPLFAVADLGHRLRLLPERLVSFVHYAMGTPEQRRQIYRSWVSGRQLSFSIPSLYKTLKNNDVEVWLFVGKYDPVIPPSRMKALAKRLPADRFVVLESSHGGLVEKAALFLLKKPQNSDRRKDDQHHDK